MINNWQLKNGATSSGLVTRRLYFFPPCTNGPKYSFPHFHHRQHHNYFLGNHYDHTIRWLHYTLNCNFPLWKLKELRVEAVSILGEGGVELCLRGDEESQPCQRECASHELLPDASPSSVDQLAYWPAHKEHFPILSHLAFQVKSIGLRQWEEITAPVLVHLPQWMKKKWFPLLRFIVTFIS